MAACFDTRICYFRICYFMMSRCLLLTCSIALFACPTPLSAAISDDAKRLISQDLAEKKYRKLGRFLNYEVAHEESDLLEIRVIAEQAHSKSLINAIDAARRFNEISRGLGLSKGNFLEIALFIETGLKQKSAQGQYYLPQKSTGLPCPL